MALTDLTGTKWLFNERVYRNNIADDCVKNINFISNNQSFGILDFLVYKPNNIEVFYGEELLTAYNRHTGWTNEAYRTIEITDGTDVTDSELIEWLQANAKQVLPTIADNLTALQNIKTAIKQALEDKGVDMTNVPFTQYAEKVGEI